MIKEDLIEVILILLIAILFCLPLFIVYNFQQTKVDNIEKDVTEIKKEIYNLRLDMLTR